MPRFRFSLFALALLFASFPLAAQAEDYKPDDRVIFDLTAEDWVNTKSARLTVNVEASVNSASAGTTRAAMTKALADLIKTDWRLISFSRDQDSTGMEHWSALHEARVPENQLSGIHEAVKKLSKPGMQLSVSGIDFSPTLDEIQAAMGLLRTKIYKMANEQLAALNATMPGRNYRIALINFNSSMGGDIMVAQDMDERPARIMRGKATMAGMAEESPPSPPMERSEKLVMSANIVFAVTPPPASSAAQPAMVR